MSVTLAYIEKRIIIHRGTQLAGRSDILQHKQAPKVSISVYQQVREKRKNLQSFQLAEEGLFLFL